MGAERIHASVGMHHNGTVNCYNRKEDVTVVIKLLNAISNTEGGTKEAPLAASLSPKQLFFAILKFQKTQNERGRRVPRLSVDGHVDPGAATLDRLSEVANKFVGPQSNKKAATVQLELDPNARLGVQALIDQNRPAIPAMLQAAIDALEKCQIAFEPPRKLVSRETAAAIDALGRFFHVTGNNVGTQKDGLLRTIRDNYIELQRAFPRVAGDQVATDYQTFLRDAPELAVKEDGKPTKKPSFTDQARRKMFFNPIYRPSNSDFLPPFDGFDPSQLPGLQVHEMCHLYLDLDDEQGRTFDTLAAERCVKLPDSYRFFAQRVSGVPTP